MKFTIWQCTDWCCEEKPRAKRWWNVAIAPGSYESFPSWKAALNATHDLSIWVRRWAS